MKIRDIFTANRRTSNGDWVVDLPAKVAEFASSATVRWIVFLLAWKFARAAKIEMKEVEQWLGAFAKATADGVEYIAALLALLAKIRSRTVFRPDGPPVKLPEVSPDLTREGVELLDALEHESPRPSLFAPQIPLRPRAPLPERRDPAPAPAVPAAPPTVSQGPEGEIFKLAYDAGKDPEPYLEKYRLFTSLGLSARVALDQVKAELKP